MVLNPELVIPPKYAKRKPALRKKEGSPTNKRVARLKEKEVEEDVHPYVEKAKADSFCFLFMLLTCTCA